MKDKLSINILQSRTFRRLKGKKQAFNHQLDDHCRDRMTHSLEVLGIAELIMDQINNKVTKRNIDIGNKIDEKSVRSIALLHDIGHTPYGHVGERELNDICNRYMKNILNHNYLNEPLSSNTGFKHNLQGVYILEKIDSKILDELNKNEKEIILSGVLNHTSLEYKQNSDLGFYDEFVYNYSKTYIEGNIVYLADEIAQLYSDFEDALDRKLIHVDKYDEFVTENNPSFEGIRTLIRTAEGLNPGFIFGYLYEYVLKDLISNLIKKLNQNNKNQKEIFNPKKLSYKYSSLKEFLSAVILSNDNVKDEDELGKRIIRLLFDYYYANPNVLKDETLQKLSDKHNFNKLSELKISLSKNELPLNLKIDLIRLIVNHISGMTDHYATSQYEAIQ
ncbi:MAG: dGTP triphosphohydrolase [archaeon]